MYMNVNVYNWTSLGDGDGWKKKEKHNDATTTAAEQHIQAAPSHLHCQHQETTIQ